ncbi:hypothetical protein C8R43DRAFT_1245104 [Mycena crocata]|nr:hypothetical protein C8R43DRAFT_1245104 [Mycena crocata]
MATPKDDSPVADSTAEEPVPVVEEDEPEGGQDSGEESDDYEDNFDGEGGGSDGEEDDDEEDGVQPSQSMTALLLGNPNAPVIEEEEEDEEEDDDDEYVEPESKIAAPSAEAPVAASKKRGIEDVAPEDDGAEPNGEAKKPKA